MLSIQELFEYVRETAAACTAGSPPPLLADLRRVAAVFRLGARRNRWNRLVHRTVIPPTCMFSATWRCNLSCKGCYAGAHTPARQLSAREIGSVVRRMVRHGTCVFIITGGEPLLVPGLIEELAGIRDAFFVLFTNGTLLDDGSARAIRAAGSILPVISVEGTAADTDARRGVGVGAAVVAAMERLRNMDMPFAFSTTVTARNMCTVTERGWLADLWNRGARFGFYLDYIPMPATYDASLVLDVAGENEKDKRLASLRAANVRPLFVRFPADEYRGGACLAAGKGFIHINADGMVEPCPFSHFAVDSILERPYPAVLRSMFLRAVRRLPESGHSPRDGCLLFARREHVAAIARETGAVPTA